MTSPHALWIRNRARSREVERLANAGRDEEARALTRVIARDDLLLVDTPATTLLDFISQLKVLGREDNLYRPGRTDLGARAWRGLMRSAVRMKRQIVTGARVPYVPPPEQ